MDPDYVVVGESNSYNLEMITKAIRLVNAGAKLIGTNYDVTGPTEFGIVPACRAMLAPIELATGKSAYYVGKPNPLMMRTGLKLLGVHSEEAAIIGDRMENQEGVYLAYLTDPAAIAKILPPPLVPFPTPVVTVSVCHIANPTFADDYYETILGVYTFYGKQLGLYTVSLLLGGKGAEMATQCGRDNGAIPKKLDAEFVIRRHAGCSRAGLYAHGEGQGLKPA